MSTPLRVHRVVRAGDWTVPSSDRLTLDYAARFLRRKLVITDQGQEILVDFAQTQSLDHGDAFALPDGQFVEICAAPEALLEVRGSDLPRLAWHIGNRHTPCQIAPDCLRLRADKVMADMLTLLGATVTTVTAPFTPEGGAYGQGRTHGHSHHDDHTHDHQHHAHGQDHDHGHSH